MRLSTMVPPHSLRGKMLRLPFRLFFLRTVMPLMHGHLRGMKRISGSSDHSCRLGVFKSDKENAFSAQVRTGQVVFDVGPNAEYFWLLASVLVPSNGMVSSAAHGEVLFSTHGSPLTLPDSQPPALSPRH